MSNSPDAPTLAVSSEVFDRFPDYVLAVVCCSGLVAEAAGEVAELAEAERRLHERFADAEELMGHPRQAAWRAAYRSLGISHSKYPNAAAAVGRRVLKHGSLPRINWAVDLCNAASLDCSLPVASCALDRLPTPELKVRFSTGGEQFRPIGAGEAETVDAGEVIYADTAATAHSRRWNWRQSDDVRTDSDTRDLIITVETVLSGDGAGPGDVAGLLAEKLSSRFTSVTTATLAVESSGARSAG